MYMSKMSRENEHKVCIWLNEFDEDVELEDSDDSDTDSNFVPDNVPGMYNNNSAVHPILTQ